MMLLVLSLVACGPEPSVGGGAGPAGTGTADTADSSAPTSDGDGYAARVAPLVEQRCGGCHMDGRSSGGMNLDAGHAALVGVPSNDVPTMSRVEPGDPARSYVWHKVNGTQLEVGGAGEQMPTQFALKDDELATIEGGALP